MTKNEFRVSSSQLLGLVGFNIRFTFCIKIDDVQGNSSLEARKTELAARILRLNSPNYVLERNE